MDVVGQSHQAIAKIQSDSLNEIRRLNGYGRIVSFLRTDFGIIVALVGAVSAVLAPYFLIKQDIALLKHDLDSVKESIEGVGGLISQNQTNIALISNRLSNLEGIISGSGIIKKQQ